MTPAKIIDWIQIRARSLRRQPVLAASIGTLIIAILVADAMLIGYLRHQAISQSERETQNLSYVLAEQTDRALQSVKIATSDIVHTLGEIEPRDVEDFEQVAAVPIISEILRDKLSSLSQLSDLSIVSAHGKIVNRSTAGPIPEYDLATSPFLTSGRDAAPGELQISQPVYNHLTRGWNVYLSQRVSTAKGEFLGVVTGAMDLQLLEALHSRIRLGPNGSITIARRDGILLSRYPRADAMMGTSVAKVGVFPTLIARGRDGVVRVASPIDNRERVVAGFRAQSFPLVMIVTAALDDVLAVWHRQTASLIFVGLGAAIGLSLLALVLARGTQQLASAQSELVLAQERARTQAYEQKQHERFSAAIENMRQGLAMFDEDGTLIVCNRQYGALYKLPPELTAPGTTRAQMLVARQRQRTDARSRTRDPQSGGRVGVNELTDGRTIAIAESAMAEGGWVSTHEDITEKRQAEQRIVHLARHDALTDLPNRFLFQEKLNACMAALPPGERIAVHYLDLDRFKTVNDTLGHHAGDALLRKVATRLNATLRHSDLLARLGGDEFAIIQPLRSGRDDAGVLAARIAEVIARPFMLGEHKVTIGASIGISVAPEDTRDSEQIIKNADMALYVAKGKGRGRAQFFKREMEEETLVRVRTEHDIRNALRDGEFELFYQPQVRLSDAMLIGFEALLRWNHPTRGLLAPGAFIQIAEETGLIAQLGEWVIEEACREAAKWPSHLRVAVNLSVSQLQSESLVPCVAAALARSSLQATRLELEVTESVMLDEAEANVSTLFQLRSLGVKISMDDFGTGYSSLSCLTLFPFDKLKIDRCFVKDLGSREDCAAIVRSATSLATTLGMITTAEGIETDEQMSAARLAGCTEGQGYLFGRPVPASTAFDLIRTGNSRKVA